LGLIQKLERRLLQELAMIRDTSSMDRPVDRRRALSRRNRTLAVGAAVLLGLALLVLPAARRWLASETSVELTRVRIETIVRGDLVRDVAAEGRIVAAFHPTIFAPDRGVVTLAVEAGRTVVAGDLLARLDSPELQSRLGQERSALRSLRADLERQRILAKQTGVQNDQQVRLIEVEYEAAERAMERAERSRDEGILNAVEYEAAKDAVRVARLRLELARQQASFQAESLDFEVQDRISRVAGQQLVVDDLERRVDELALRSPVDGLVSRIHVEDRDAIAQGQPVVTVVDLSAFEIEISVAESYADEIGSGTSAVIFYNGREYPGEVESISPEVAGSRVLGRVVFTGAAPEGLRQNQRVSTRLIFETRRDVLKVARGPFVEGGGGRQAYRVEDGMAVLRPIEIGSLSVSEVEIVGGLELGDRIIVSDVTRFEGASKVLLRD